MCFLFGKWKVGGKWGTPKQVQGLVKANFHSAHTLQENKSHWNLTPLLQEFIADPEGNVLCLCTGYTVGFVEHKDRGRLHQESES